MKIIKQTIQKLGKLQNKKKLYWTSFYSILYENNRVLKKINLQPLIPLIQTAQFYNLDKYDFKKTYIPDSMVFTGLPNSENLGH